MRLINTNTLELREFFGTPPPYAILSHTWEDEEVSLHEMTDRAPSLATKKGYRKIVDYCHLAARQGYAWVWVDTCCINKTSDAELSESINSMFRWYENAARVEFYDQGWVVRGTKDDLVGELSAITKIDPSALRGEYRRFRIGVRISWAANRETTRPEDIAYCLLGLLDINMPMLYGEGQRAFRRLQEEIIRKSNDLSIFAWDEDAAEDTGFTALLAPSPRQFAIHQELRELLPTGLPPRNWQPEYAITNNGLRIRTRLQLLLHVPEPGTNKDPSTDDGEKGGSNGRPQYFLPLAEAFSTDGEIVDAACVNTAADRQLTPTTINGTPALLVQRSFSSGFRPDLVAPVMACVGFNGTHFRAEDCGARGIQLVAFTGGQLKAAGAGGACASGHDERAQMTVDVSGRTCARLNWNPLMFGSSNFQLWRTVNCDAVFHRTFLCLLSDSVALMAQPDGTTEPKPVFDNFYSPRNEDFYRRSPYKALAKTSRELRLICLSPGEQDDPIVCELVDNVSLESARSEYLAISYYAGDPADTVPITVNGMKFNAFATLGNAIRHVRLSAEALARLVDGGRKQLLWVDQICIDQSNVSERAHQVGLMKDIYEGAGHVMVWLGGESGDGRALRFLNRQYHLLTELVEAIQAAQDADSPSDPKVVWAYSCERLALRFAGDTRNEAFVEHWRSVRQLILSPWWSRCWVAQELIVSRAASLVFGPAVMSWDKFRDVFELVDKIVTAIFLRMTSSAVHPEGDDELQRLGGLIQDMTMDHVKFMIQKQREWEKAAAMKLLPLLRHGRSCKSSDPRDRVYAFLGLADPRYNIVPIYDPTINTIEDTLCYTAKRIISHDRRLHILSLSQERGCQKNSNLPSWVPDWRVPSGLPCLLDLRYRASGDYPAEVSFPLRSDGAEGQVLRTACLIIDQLAESPAALVTQHDDGTVSSTVWKWLPLTGVDLNVPTWEEQRYLYTGQARREALISVLHLGQDLDLQEGVEKQEVFKFEAQVMRESLELRQRRLHETVCSDTLVFFKSPKGFMGLADRRARHTDCIAVALGASVPYILRKEGGHYRLIGEAYVHGIMEGEAIQMMSRESSRLR
ncbi:hypothetical protein NEMBOFW57_000310 [Staphylotrichum longicolle]|uniref:Heterokaryon incompatibility domain-containing protein n=1 Tax=Staphylotrichum longicolle TaxID=669026 RepID=A0AAD4I0T3_9PEZI|nr:hypothetical protein NEMBOFW57_000310 [Staphylotrichum longicolle]